VTTFPRFQALAPRGDSRDGRSSSRTAAVELLIAALRALILFPVQGVLVGADRTVLRPMLMGSADQEVWSRIQARRRVNQPDTPWTISRTERIQSPFARLFPGGMSRAADHLLHRHSV